MDHCDTSGDGGEGAIERDLAKDSEGALRRNGKGTVLHGCWMRSIIVDYVDANIGCADGAL